MFAPTGVIATLLIAVAASAGGAITGLAYAVHGDTLRIGRTQVQLCGIQVPGRHEAGYHMSMAYLSFLIRDQVVRCMPAADRMPCDERLGCKDVVSQCFVGDIDLSEMMVKGLQAQGNGTCGAVPLAGR